MHSTHFSQTYSGNNLSHFPCEHSALKNFCCGVSHRKEAGKKRMLKKSLLKIDTFSMFTVTSSVVINTRRSFLLLLCVFFFCLFLPQHVVCRAIVCNLRYLHISSSIYFLTIFPLNQLRRCDDGGWQLVDRQTVLWNIYETIHPHLINNKT